MRLLLVEDDQHLGDTVQRALQLEGYAVDWLTEGNTVVSATMTTPYDLIVLDVGLPGMDGYQVVTALRDKRNRIPVLMLTARDAIPDRISGLDAGADDYLTKPFDIDELFARIRSLIRRSGDNTSNEMVAGNLNFDSSNRSVTFAGDAVDLTARELAILEVLLRNKNRFVTKEKLEDSLYSWGQEISSNTIEVYVSRLRKRFGTDFIQTKRGLGYKVQS
ncbi:MAG: response regulator transcription factor [Pseudomonadales bacterium]